MTGIDMGIIIRNVTPIGVQNVVEIDIGIVVAIVTATHVEMLTGGLRWTLSQMLV